MPAVHLAVLRPLALLHSQSSCAQRTRRLA